MLAATVILGVLITVVLGPLGQLFQNTRRNDQALQATTQAQELVENIRGSVAVVPRSDRYKCGRLNYRYQPQ